MSVSKVISVHERLREVNGVVLVDGSLGSDPVPGIPQASGRQSEGRESAGNPSTPRLNHPCVKWW